VPGENQYFTISLFNTDHGKARRRKALFDSCRCIVLDDVHEKLSAVEAARLPEPSWKLETSAGNEQWGYILKIDGFLDYTRDQIDNVLDGLVSSGLAPSGTDPGMKGVTRYVRLPEGSNTKAKNRSFIDGAGFNCAITHWQPEQKVTLAEIAAPFNIDVNAKRVTNEAGGVVCEGHPVLEVVSVLSDRGDGIYDIECPWLEFHTDGDTSGTAIWTYKDGNAGIKCHHGHCEDKTGKDLMVWCAQQPGWTGLDSAAAFRGVPAVDVPSVSFADPVAEYIPRPQVEAQVDQVDALIDSLLPGSSGAEISAALTSFMYEPDLIVKRQLLMRVQQRLAIYSVSLLEQQQKTLLAAAREASRGMVGDRVINFPDIVGDDTIIETRDNLAALMDAYKITLRRNLQTRKISTNCFTGRGEVKEDEENLTESLLKDLSAKACLGINRTRELMLALSYENTYHPFKEWLGYEEWDGQDRLGPVLGSLKEPADMDFNERAFTQRLIALWLKSIVSCAYGYAEGRAPRGVLMLTGPQNIGKSSWFRYMLPKDMFLGGQMLNISNKDDIFKVNSYLLVELAEIDGSLSNAAMAALKAFLSNTCDVHRRAYAAGDSYMDRRTVFGGSTNRTDYINDISGGSRFWTVRVDDIDLDVLGNMWRAKGNHDLKQFWLQIKAMWVEDQNTHLSPEDDALLKARNEPHMSGSDAQDTLEEAFDWDSEQVHPMSITEICETVHATTKHLKMGDVKDALAQMGVAIPHRPTRMGDRNSSKKKWFMMPSVCEGWI